MSLDSNGEVRIVLTHGNQATRDDLLTWINKELHTTVHVEEIGKDEIEITAFVHHDHFYGDTAARLAHDLLDFKGVSISEFESEILDEDGKHTKVILDGKQVKMAIGEVVYRNFDTVEK